jgi:hypothetical protein
LCSGIANTAIWFIKSSGTRCKNIRLFESKKSITMKLTYSMALVFILGFIWALMHEAQFLAYDENWGNILSAFFISLLATLCLLILWFKCQSFILECKWQTLLFLIFGSPFTIVIVVMNYNLIFGSSLKV